jgi:hypothetical protein
MSLDRRLFGTALTLVIMALLPSLAGGQSGDGFDPEKLEAILCSQAVEASETAALDRLLKYARENPEVSATVADRVARSPHIGVRQRVLAVFLLGQLGFGEPVEALRGLVATEDSQIRFAALTTLAAVSPQPPWAFEAFSSAAGDNQDVMVAEGGIMGLLRMKGDQRVQRRLRELYHGSDTAELLRVQIGKELIRRGADLDKSLVARLLRERLAMSGLPVLARLDAAGDLAVFGDTSAVHYLLDALEQDETRLIAYRKLTELAPGGPKWSISRWPAVNSEDWRRFTGSWRQWDLGVPAIVPQADHSRTRAFLVSSSQTRPTDAVTSQPSP